MNTALYNTGLEAGVTSASPWPLNRIKHVFIVSEGFTALLYHQGRFVQRLDVGRHVRWGRNYAVTPVDLRRSLLAVAGQEVLTADNIGIKVSATVAYQVTDPIKAVHDVQNWLTELYNSTQVALRSTIAAHAAEALLKDRLEIGRQLLTSVQPPAEATGVTVHAVEVKDAMLPGELKKVFTEVLRAKQEGQAALERARGETAALRNLANAARIMENNPALMNLRLMQSINGAGSTGNTLVLGIPAGFVPLRPSAEGQQTE